MLTQQLVNKNVREVRYFFYSQAFADGLRATIAILLPALIASYFGQFETGLTISLGAMCVSLTDAPGPLRHKRNGMLACIGFAFLVALLTALARNNFYSMGLTVALVTFFFSLFVVFGTRATGVGNAAILVMILNMDRPVAANEALLHAGLLMAGGLFYLTLSLVLYRIQPYRQAQRVLGDCIREVAAYLAVRAAFYNTATDLESTYKRMVAQQVVVNEKQDLVREVFFKTRRIAEESTDESRKLVFTFVAAVDLFEDITASYYDYRLLRELFSSTGPLELIHASLKKLVDELNAVGLAIQSDTSFQPGFDYDEEVRQLKAAIDAVAIPSAQRLLLRRLVVNIRNLLLDLRKMEEYFVAEPRRRKTDVDHSHFVSHQSFDPKLLWDNLAFKSVAFRHALRVSLACLAGFAVARLFVSGAHSYWILLTIAFIIKPAFSLTKQRNIQRIIGTVAGALVGVVLLLLVKSTTLLFLFMVVFMILTYSFMRVNYLVMVSSVTPYVLILFSFLGTEFRVVATERLIDTLIGCAIAFPASYFLFPTWEKEQLKEVMQGILKANAGYLEKIIRALRGEAVDIVDYKLARKEVYLASANLSAAFERMLSEPKSKQARSPQVQQFVVLNHLFFSNLATVARSLSHDKKPYAQSLVQGALKTHHRLRTANRLLAGEELAVITEAATTAPGTNDPLLEEQLSFVHQLAKDIEKLAALLAEKPQQG